MAALRLLSRRYCHLCDDMLAELSRLRDAQAFELDVVDIDLFPELEARYGDLVPVLLAGEMELCHYHFDEQAVRAYLSRG